MGYFKGALSSPWAASVPVDPMAKLSRMKSQAQQEARVFSSPPQMPGDPCMFRPGSCSALPKPIRITEQREASVSNVYSLEEPNPRSDQSHPPPFPTQPLKHTALLISRKQSKSTPLRQQMYQPVRALSVSLCPASAHKPSATLFSVTIQLLEFGAL